MARKSETFGKFKEFKVEAKTQLEKSLKEFWLDRGGEYLDNEFKDYLLENETLSQLTAPSTRQQNGIAERRNLTLLDIVMSMLSFSSLPLSL